MMNFLKPYLGVIQAMGLVIALVVIFGVGVQSGADHVQTKWDAAELSRQEAQQDLARETRRAFDAITMKSRKEREDAIATIAALRADVRAGAVRLSIPVAARPTGDPRAGDQQARAELLPETADDLVGLAGDADNAVRDLNECIDKYSTLASR